MAQVTTSLTPAVNVEEAINSIETAAFIKVKSVAVFNDMNIITKSIKNFNELGEALALATNYQNIVELREQLEKFADTTKDRNQKAKIRQELKSLTNIKKLAKEQGLRMDPKFLENLSFLLKYGFQDQFEVQLPIKNYVFTGNLKRECIKEDEQLLVRKYSRHAEKEFVMFGTIAQCKKVHIDLDEEEEGKDYQNIKEALMALVEKLSIVESTFTGRLSNEIIIDPIAVYREL